MIRSSTNRAVRAKFGELVTAAAIAVFAFAYAPSAKAGLSLTLEANGVTQSVNDTDGNGQVGFVGSLGVFWLNVTAGQSVQSVGQAILNLFSFSASSQQAGSLTMTLTDDGYTGPIGENMTVTSLFNATAGLDLDYASYIDGTLIGSVSGAQAGENHVFTKYATTQAPYTLTQVVTVTHAGIGHLEVSSFDATTIVASEPPMLATFAIGMLGLGFLARRRSKRELS